jgi:hypothetical protein
MFHPDPTILRLLEWHLLRSASGTATGFGAPYLLFRITMPLQDGYVLFPPLADGHVGSLHGQIGVLFFSLWVHLLFLYSIHDKS